MKKVVTNKELREKMKVAIELLCGTVKMTLGPKGSNVIIDHSTFSPFITNDGVTIAENIESEDEVINTILELAKEASIHTNVSVGDGTTTTLVLLESIFNNGLKLIDEGMNPIIVKQKLDEHIDYLTKLIKRKSNPTNENNLYNIAISSANDEIIARNLIDAYKKTRSLESITIKENKDNENNIVYKNGYIIESLISSPHFFKDKKEIKLDSPNVLIINNYLNDIEDIATILNYIIRNNEKLVLFVDDFSENFNNEIVNLNLNESVEVYLLKIPEYGKNKIDLISDLSLITKSIIVNDISYISETSLGNVSRIIINKEEVNFAFDETDDIKNKIEELKVLLKDNKDEYVSKRVSMFASGLVDIHVGGNTDIERREKKMRYDDALCALISSSAGVVVGSGLTLYEISEEMKDVNEVSIIFKNSLKEPFNQIMYNAGLNNNEIIKNIKDENFNIVYNVNENKYEDIKITKVIDPTLVVTNSLINAISIAGMLLTTTSLIINEYQNNLNKMNTYMEM